MVIDREQIMNVLGTIIEPDLKKDIVSLNLVEDIQFSPTSIELVVNVSNPALHRVLPVSLRPGDRVFRARPDQLA
jgi:ATP-binding protein involved in chromosome partitioning